MTTQTQASVLAIMSGTAGIAEKVKRLLAAIGSGDIDPDAIEETIRVATEQAVSDTLKEIEGLAATELLNRTDEQRMLQSIQNELSPKLKYAFEFFHPLYALSDVITVADVESVTGDDSIDMESTTKLKAGQEYIIQNDSIQETITVKEILSVNRIRTQQPVQNTIRGGQLVRTNWKYITATAANGGATLATAKKGQVYYSDTIDVSSAFVSSNRKAMILRTDEGVKPPTFLYRKANSSTAWTPVVWEYQRPAPHTPSKLDIEYTFEYDGEFEVKIVATENATIDFIMFITSPSGIKSGLHHPPAIPTCVLPADGATDVGETPALTTSAYTHLAKTAQRGVFIEVSKKADDFTGENLVFNSGERAGVSVAPDKGVLQTNTKYYQRAKHIDALDGISEWSAVTCFTTAGSFVSIDTPRSTAPVAGAELSSPDGLTLTSNPFSTTGDSDTHAASQWQIAKNPNCDTIHWDSSEDSANKVSKSVPDGTVERGETYYWRCRHKGANKGWSDWSVGNVFTISRVAIEE
jgi:hypothetical protein